MKKNDLAHALATTGRFAMKAIAETMGVALPSCGTDEAASKVAALPLLQSRRCLAVAFDSRTCGSSHDLRIPQIGALNRKLSQMGKPAVNHKRVYRIMRQNDLLLTRHTGKRPQLAHEGKVVTLRSNLRWCSDGFEIACWNGQVVRVAFALDCCDCEIISHVATTGGITGEMVRDLMIESVERRFGPAVRLPPRGMA